MLRYLGCAGVGLLVLILASVACGATHAGAAPYQSGFYYPYYPWYWGGLYSHYPYVEHHYIDYHGGYTRNGTLAPGYSYDPAKNVVVTRSGQPVYPNPHGVDDIKPQGNTPNPRSLSGAPNYPVTTKSAAGGSCSGQNNCTGGGNAVTNKSGGNAPPGGSNGAACSGQSNCMGGGNAGTNKSGGSGSGAPSNSGSNSAKPGGSNGSGPPKASGPSKPSGPAKSGGSSGGGSRSGGGKH